MNVSSTKSEDSNVSYHSDKKEYINKKTSYGAGDNMCSQVDLSLCVWDVKCGEESLWKAVITQALMDAGSDSKKPEMRYEKAQAISWLSGVSKDFHAVCALAGLRSEYVKERAAQAIKRGCKWRMEAIKNSKEKVKIHRSKAKNHKTTYDTSDNVVIFAL